MLQVIALAAVLAVISSMVASVEIIVEAARAQHGRLLLQASHGQQNYIAKDCKPQTDAQYSECSGSYSTPACCQGNILSGNCNTTSVYLGQIEGHTSCGGNTYLSCCPS